MTLLLVTWATAGTMAVRPSDCLAASPFAARAVPLLVGARDRNTIGAVGRDLFGEASSEERRRLVAATDLRLALTRWNLSDADVTAWLTCAFGAPGDTLGVLLAGGTYAGRRDTDGAFVVPTPDAWRAWRDGDLSVADRRLVLWHRPANPWGQLLGERIGDADAEWRLDTRDGSADGWDRGDLSIPEDEVPPTVWVVVDGADDVVSADGLILRAAAGDRVCGTRKVRWVVRYVTHIDLSATYDTPIYARGSAKALPSECMTEAHAVELAGAANRSLQRELGLDEFALLGPDGLPASATP